MKLVSWFLNIIMMLGLLIGSWSCGGQDQDWSAVSTAATGDGAGIRPTPTYPDVGPVTTDPEKIQTGLTAVVYDKVTDTITYDVSKRRVCENGTAPLVISFDRRSALSDASWEWRAVNNAASIVGVGAIETSGNNEFRDGYLRGLFSINIWAGFKWYPEAWVWSETYNHVYDSEPETIVWLYPGDVFEYLYLFTYSLHPRGENYRLKFYYCGRIPELKPPF